MHQANPLVFLIIVILIWLLPVITLIASRKTAGIEKLIWLAAMLLLSWLAWAFYLWLAPIGKGRPRT